MDPINTTLVDQAKEKHAKRHKLIQDLEKLYEQQRRWHDATSIHHAIVQHGATNNSSQVIIPDELFEPVRVLSLNSLDKDIKELETELINL